MEPNAQATFETSLAQFRQVLVLESWVNDIKERRGKPTVFMAPGVGTDLPSPAPVVDLTFVRDKKATQQLRRHNYSQRRYHRTRSMRPSTVIPGATWT